MQIVIDIPDNYILSNIKNGSIASQMILNAVKNGISLPKGHGRLKDIDKIERLLDLENSDNKIAKALKNIIESVPTIIEADTAESGDKSGYFEEECPLSEEEIFNLLTALIDNMEDEE